MNKDILKEIGLTDSEVKVYLSLLELGDSTRNNIVNKSQVTGSKIYEILEKLQEKSLVSIYIKNKIKHFKPVNPKQILNYLEDKRDKIENIEKKAKLILPNLTSLFNSSKGEEEVELIVGMKGLEIIFREQIDLLSKGNICYVIGGTRGSIEEEQPIYAFFRKIHMLREKKGIKTKMLYNIKQRKMTKKQFSSKEYKSTQTKYIEHTSPVAVNIYKDRTVIIIFSKKINSIYIKSKEVANSFLEYFNLLWKTSKN